MADGGDQRRSAEKTFAGVEGRLAMPSDYYMVLGVERGANLSQIKHAYRNAIKRYHPDRVGTGTGTDPDKFIAAREAYEVLSDLDRRRAYDAAQSREGIPVRLTDVRKTLRRRRKAWHALRETQSATDDFFEGSVPGFYRKRFRRPSVPKDLYMEVVLTPDEAMRGGIFPVAVPVVVPCPDCGQSGWGEGFFCSACRGYGALRAKREFNLTIPPDVPDGTAVELLLTDLGLPGVRLFIELRVSLHP
jgi:molecular chaperone DnaJ